MTCRQVVVGACQHFDRGPATARPAAHHCAFFGYRLTASDLRVDCAEHVGREDTARWLAGA